MPVVRRRPYPGMAMGITLFLCALTEPLGEFWSVVRLKHGETEGSNRLRFFKEPADRPLHRRETYGDAIFYHEMMDDFSASSMQPAIPDDLAYQLRGQRPR
jgi:hypothetical protein